MYILTLFAVLLSSLPLLALTSPTSQPQSYPPQPATCSPRPALRNPSFESGEIPPLFPSPPPARGWYIGSLLGSTTYSLTTPGSPLPPGGGNKAFTAQMIPNINSKGLSGLTLQQNLLSCARQNYSVQVDYRFKEVDADNNCKLTISYPFFGGVRGSVETGSSVVQPGQWHTTASFFPGLPETEPGSRLFDISFFCRYGVRNEITVDNVRIEKFDGNVS